MNYPKPRRFDQQKISGYPLLATWLLAKPIEGVAFRDSFYVR